MKTQKVKLVDVLESVSDAFLFDEHTAPVLVNTSDVIDGKVTNHKQLFNGEIKGQFKKTFVKGDILYSEIRPKNKHFAFVDFDSDNYVASTKLMVLRPKNEAILPRFAYLYLTSESIVKFLQEMAESRSGTFPQITFDEIARLEIDLPSISEQEKILSVISAFDSKIEVNNKLNAKLEELARAVFEERFGGINNGDGVVGEYLTPKRGKNLLKKDAIEGDVPVVAGGLEPATFHNKANTNTPVITISASGANAGFLKLWHVPVWSSDSSFIDYSVTKDVYFWYMFLKNRQSEIYDAQTGSAQPHIYPKHIAELSIGKVDETEISEYTQFVTPYFQAIGNNQKESHTLATLRDTLLPKLMRGELIPNPENLIR